MSLASRQTVRYPGGSVTASLGAIQKLLGQQVLGWSVPITDTDVEKRRPYSSKRASRAAAGTPAIVTFSDGEKWTYRVTGNQKAFLTEVIGASGGSEVSEIKFQRKTVYSPTPQAPLPVVP